MSNLIECIFAIEEGNVGGDALILQPKTPGGNGAPAYHLATGIIQRIPTVGGMKWVMRQLYYRGGGFTSAGSGMYADDLNDIVKYAERAFGVKSDVREWVWANYTDSDFPPNLLPGM